MRALIYGDDVDGAMTYAIWLDLAGHDVKVAIDRRTFVALVNTHLPELVVIASDTFELGSQVTEFFRGRVRENKPYIIEVACDGNHSSGDGIDVRLINPVDPTQWGKALKAIQKQLIRSKYLG